MFLQFARPEQRVAYAPSIGLETIENQERLMYKERWSHWRALSSRETKGAEIIADGSSIKTEYLINLCPFQGVGRRAPKFFLR